jgi:hypothetical protein
VKFKVGDYVIANCVQMENVLDIKRGTVCQVTCVKYLGQEVISVIYDDTCNEKLHYSYRFEPAPQFKTKLGKLW